MNRIESVFDKKKVFLPVVHPLSRDHALRALHVARKGGADGVFLINQGMKTDEVLALAHECMMSIPDFWIGVNILDANVQSLVSKFDCEACRPDGVWSDRAGSLAERGGWDGLYFGGVAFKYQKEVNPEDEEREIYKALTHGLVDVVTTSGPGTGEPADVNKVRRMQMILGDDPLAIASGITPGNVRQYTPYVDAFLVATGIELEFGVFDPEKLRRVADAIHEA